MKVGVGLLRRVREPELARPRRRVTDKELREAILEHLRNMCRTRLGTMVSTPDFGLPDLTETLHAHPDMVRGFARALAETIRRYEPRLTAVTVTPAEPTSDVDLHLRFIVTAEIVDDKRRSVAFETRIESSRRIGVT
jgi:type VI secretion system protein